MRSHAERGNEGDEGGSAEESDVINVNVSTATRWGLNAVILLSIILALYLGQTIFIPMVISLLLAAMLWPTATWMHQSGVPVPCLWPRRAFPWLRPGIAHVHFTWGMACLTVVTGFVALRVPDGPRLWRGR